MNSILFDLDGTLVDSSIGIKSAFNYCFTQLQMEVQNDKQLSSFIGPPLETTFARYFDNENDISHAIKVFREYYKEKGVFQVKLYNDIDTLLKQLKQLEKKLFITTSKNEAMARLMLSNLGIEHFFDGIYGSIEKRFLKEDIIKECLKEEKLALDDTVIIGDTKFDIIGGKHTNIHTLGVTWGFGTHEDLKNAKADKIVSTPLDIIKNL